MSSELHQPDMAPALPPDEGYWSALLAEEEDTRTEANIRQDDLFSQEFQDSVEYEEKELNSGTLADWEQVEQVKRADAVVELRVIGYNRGGLLVEWGSLRGFVPASQLVDFPSDHETSGARRKALMTYVSERLHLRVIELEKAQSRLILSERAAQTPAGARDDILSTLEPGDVTRGKVTNLCSFGAFVDLGGVEGLIHISELSWGRVRHPADLLQPDQMVNVYVIDVNSNEGRVALSVKRLQPDPWGTVEERYHIGQRVEGTVTNVVDFGAFVCIEEGLEGLIHISELAEGHFLHPYNVVQEGERVTARILHIDGRGRRLGLSLRRSEREIRDQVESS
jgi:small subunit ribosomal protein S1